MNKEIKEKWLEALRSGEYSQTRGHLRNTLPEDEDQPYPIGYCCLGVLCDLYAKEHGADDLWEQNNDGNWSFDGAFGTPPSAVIDWANLGTATGAYYQEKSPRLAHLTEKNDEGRTFKEIAGIIEEYF